MEDLNTQILNEFELKPSFIYKEKNRYICNTDKGLKVIKKVSSNIENILIESSIKNHLISSGFKNIDTFCLSKKNIPYYVFNNNIYVVTDFISNETVDIKSKAIFLNLIESVSKMHVCIRGLNLKHAPIKQGIELDLDYNKALKKFMSIKKLLNSKNRLSDFDVIFIKQYASYINDIELCLYILNDANYTNYRNSAMANQHICHNLLKNEYLLLKDSDVYITNFSSCTIDLNLIDLSKIIKKYVKSNPCNQINIVEVLNTYCKYNYLCDNEVKILYASLLYPSKFIKTCNFYYLKQRKWVSSSIINRIETSVLQKVNLNNYINTIKP